MLPAQLQRQATFQDRTPTGSFGPRPEGYTTPALGNHKATHQTGGTDEIDVGGLSGVLADPQTPAAHHLDHENSGADEISVSGLSGELADAQPPKSHGNAAHSATFATEAYAVAAAVAEVDAHEGLADPHTGYVKHSLATAVSDFLVASGVGAFVKKTLAEVKTILGLGTAAFTAATDYAVAAKGVTNGDGHTHAGGDGGTIGHNWLGGLSADDHPQYAPKSDPTFTTKITTPQVQFPAAQSASADPNNLDDYEEGTWTTSVSGVTNFTGTPTLTEGRYTKIGNLVSLQGKFSGTVTTANLLTYFAFTIPFSPAYTTVGAAMQSGGIRVGNSYVGAAGNGYLFFPPPSAIVAGADDFFFQVTFRV